MYLQKYILIYLNVSSKVYFKLSFDISYKVCLNVPFNISFQVSFDISYNVSFNVCCVEDLITAMEPSLSVYVPIIFLLCAWLYVCCSSMCDWVRKPPFRVVLRCKTTECFNLDQCASLNLTFSIGVLRLKRRCWNGSLTVPIKRINDLTRHKYETHSRLYSYELWWLADNFTSY